VIKYIKIHNIIIAANRTIVLENPFTNSSEPKTIFPADVAGGVAGGVAADVAGGVAAGFAGGVAAGVAAGFAAAGGVAAVSSDASVVPTLFAW
jgi:hypothetical protein